MCNAMRSFTPIETISYESAKKILGEHRLPKTIERCRLENAVGRVLAFPVESQCDLPQFDNSAVDGFAICEDDRKRLGHETVMLDLVGTLEAGHRGELPTLRSGTAIRVLTGGPVPVHTGAIAMQEDVTIDGDRIAICCPLAPERNIRWRGEECMIGTWLFEAGTCITPATVGALAATGCDTVEVFRFPKVGILTTGSEVVNTGDDRLPYQTYDANGPSLLTALRVFGIQDVRLVHAQDDPVSVEGAVNGLLDDCDLVICAGGVSVGDRDAVRPALDAAGVETLIQGVAIRPGKPFYFGQCESQVVFGLPGNPLSAMVNYLIFVVPYLRQAVGLMSCGCCRARPARLMEDLGSGYGLRHFIPGNLVNEGFEPARNRCSSMLTGLGAANALAVIPEELCEAKQGDEIDVLPISWQACNL